MTNARTIDLTTKLEAMPKEWRTRWCTYPDNGGCGCMGCANYSGGLLAAGFTLDEWRAAMVSLGESAATDRMSPLPEPKE